MPPKFYMSIELHPRKREVEFQEMRERQSRLIEAVEELSTMLKK